MKLRQVHLTEFRSILDSNAFEIGDITCLVGKNEAGKTSVLKAIHRLRPIELPEDNYDVTRDYPRAEVEDYRHAVASKTREPATVVRATFVIDEVELRPIEEEFGQGVLAKPSLLLTRGYGDSTTVSLFVNEQAVVKAVVEKSQLPTDIADEFMKLATVTALATAIQAKSDDHSKRLQTALDGIQKEGGIQAYLYRKYLERFVPKFVYFDEYYEMTGRENVEALITRKNEHKLRDSDRPLLGLIALARLTLEELSSPTKTQELKNRLEGAGNHLSRQILKYWSQNKHLQMRFDVRRALPQDPPGMTSGTNLWADVHDTKHMATTSAGDRSHGFVWFFSFLAWYSDLKRRNEPLILLLDEPGLALHGKAQGDLLRYLNEDLGKSHQVIYTTHSPFMVDPGRFDRVRIVQDKSLEEDEILREDQGTKVLTDVLEASEDSLFPLQGALGYEIHQTLFVGPNCLIVEGVSDLLYLQTMTELLEEQGRAGLSTKWTITPVGGAEKVPTFVALLGAQRGLKLATLIDIARSSRQLVENLYARKLLQKKHVQTYGNFTGTVEADVEDMFDVGFYLSLVNAEFKAQLSRPIQERDLSSKAPRLHVRLEEYFTTNPLNGVVFNHYRPARYLAENLPALKTSIPAATLDRFEQAFKTLNALL